MDKLRVVNAVQFDVASQLFAEAVARGCRSSNTSSAATHEEKTKALALDCIETAAAFVNAAVERGLVQVL